MMTVYMTKSSSLKSANDEAGQANIFSDSDTDYNLGATRLKITLEQFLVFILPSHASFSLNPNVYFYIMNIN